MIEVDGLTKVYGATRSLDGLSFRVAEGEILGLLGPNGAGKTTTMRILTGLTRPTAGKARVGGFDVQAQHREIRGMLGYLPEEAPLYADMRIEQYLAFMAGTKKITGKRAKQAVLQAMEETDLLGIRRRVIANLSKGMRQRVGLAQAILGDPKVVILDEPTVGLDPSQISDVRKLIAGMKGRRTVVLSTHILPEVAMTCSQVVIVNRGKTVAEGSMQEIGSLIGQKRLRVVARAEEERLLETLADTLESSAEETTFSPAGEGATLMTMICRGEADPRAEIARRIVDAGIELLELAEMQPTLEDVFLRVTGKAPAEEAAAS